MQRTRIGLVLLAILVSAAPAAGQKKPGRTQLGDARVEVPMPAPRGRPVIEATINGAGPFPFVLDTGAAGVIVDSDLVKALGLTPTGSTRIGDPAEPEAIETDTYELERVEIGAASFHGVEAVRWDGPLRHVRGIIGLSVLQETLVTLDYPRERLVVTRGALRAGDGSIAYRLDQGWIVTVELDVAGQTIDAHLDSGNPGRVMLPLSMAERLPLTAPPRVVGRARTASGEFDIHHATLDGTLRFAGLTLEKPDVAFNDRFDHANIGGGLLRSYAVTIDQANRRLQFVASSGKRAGIAGPGGPAGRPTYGVVIDGNDADRMVVRGTVPGSIAERAGVRAGDEIVSLNGRDVPALSPAERAAIFRRSLVTLVVRRDGETLEIVMTHDGETDDERQTGER